MATAAQAIEMEKILYLTELQGLPVFDLREREIGRVKDAAVVPLIHRSRIDRYLVGGERAWLTVRYEQVKRIGLDGIFLLDEKLTPYHDDEYMLRLVRDLLDQQIIDAQGRKVVRVTDVTFEIRDEGLNQTLHVLEVDIGLRAIFRRLFQGILPPRLIRRLQEKIPPNSIRWEFVNIIEPDPQRRLRLNVSLEWLKSLHPADLADILEEMTATDRQAFLQQLDSELVADVLPEVDPKLQASMLEHLEASKAADIIEEMEPDQAADILAEMDRQISEEILRQMEVEPQAEVRELMRYEEDTAGGLMTTRFLALPSGASVRDAIEALRAEPELADTINTIFLVDENRRPVGAVPLGKLFLVPEDTSLKELTLPTVVTVPITASRKEVVDLFDKYNIFTLPVVDQEGRLEGVITADDVISVMHRG